jgi:hypothetical protein
MRMTNNIQLPITLLKKNVEKIGSIEISQHEMTPTFARAYDLGGTVYESKDSYPSLEAAPSTDRGKAIPYVLSKVVKAIFMLRLRHILS